MFALSGQCLNPPDSAEIILLSEHCVKNFLVSCALLMYSFLFSPLLSGEAGAGGTRWLALLFKCDTHPISILPRHQICYFEKDFFLHVNLEPDEIRLEKDIFCSVVWEIMKRLYILFVCEMPNIECDQCFKRNKGCDV